MIYFIPLILRSPQTIRKRAACGERAGEASAELSGGRRQQQRASEGCHALS